VHRAVSVRIVPLLPLRRTRDYVIDILQQTLILAQEGGAAPAPAPDDPYGFMRLLFPLAAMMFLFYFLILRPQRQRDQELRQMIANVKENDRVVTAGGIHGVVTNVQRDAERVTIRVDESNGTKLKINLSAIARVVTGDEKDNDGTSGSKTS
jgi:preprotein translocase subunit YajC